MPRLWASRRIAFLVDQIRQAGAASGDRLNEVGQTIFSDPRFKEIANEILRLSTEFGILTEYTSFLAREGTDLANFTLLCRGRRPRDRRQGRRQPFRPVGRDAVAQRRLVEEA